MPDRARDAQAAQQRLREEIAAGTAVPVPFWITTALNARALDGPEVDRALGGEEPMVDLWEEGKLRPTPQQIEALAKLTLYPVAYFYQPAPDGGRAWLCRRSGPRATRCQTIEMGPGPAPATATAMEEPPRQPPPPKPRTPAEPLGPPTRWRCLIPRCPLRRRWQTASTFQRHFLDFHHQPPKESP
ncbi:hypothetical protein ACGFJC_47265 [Nonomuraea fuscirosea]|uniref:hypothetical protein n=1 Tax=Nonomuraea fuscirosea TaxID=1291556 RepID=UPI003714C8FE